MNAARRSYDGWVSQPFRDNQLSVRERAARLAEEIHVLEQELVVLRKHHEARPLTGRQWSDVLDFFTVIIAVIGLLIGLVAAAKIVKPDVIVSKTTNCGFH